MNSFHPIFLIVSILIFSCTHDPNEFSSDCYLEAIDNFKTTSNAQKIEEYTLNEANVYFMDDGAYTYDGLSYFIDKSCDTVCTRGGFKIPDACLEDLKFVKLIWEK